MEKLKLGAQFYTLRDFTKTPGDFLRTMHRIADIGYKYVQVSGVGPDVKADVIKKACDETGLSVYITHTPFARIIDDTDAVIEEHKKFGCNIIGLGSAGDYSKSYDGFARLAQDLAPAVEKIKKAGMFFSYHNHWMEFEKLDGKHFMSAFIENSDMEAVKLTADVYWLHFSGLNECKWLEENAKYISCTHFKDLGVYQGKQTIVEVMTGNLDYPAILESCKKAGIEYNFVELDTTTMDPFKAMKLSFDNLMATGYFE